MESADSTGRPILEYALRSVFGLVKRSVKSAKRIISTNEMTVQRFNYLTKIRLFTAGAAFAVKMLIPDLLRIDMQITLGFCGSGFGNQLLDIISKNTFHNSR